MHSSSSCASDWHSCTSYWFLAYSHSCGRSADLTPALCSRCSSGINRFSCSFFVVSYHTNGFVSTVGSLQFHGWPQWHCPLLSASCSGGGYLSISTPVVQNLTDGHVDTVGCSRSSSMVTLTLSTLVIPIVPMVTLTLLVPRSFMPMVILTLSVSCHGPET
jgi:hypothetical protein